jgi:hypothetical protein
VSGTLSGSGLTSVLGVALCITKHDVEFNIWVLLMEQWVSAE